MVLDSHPGNLHDRGLVETDQNGTTVRITPAGRDFIGRR
jgi:predicted transcriptional regulator